MFVKLLTLAAAALLIGAPLRCAENPYSISQKTDEHLRRCFDSLFNLRFDEADQALSRIRNDAERHPMIALAQVVRAWWEISVNVLEADEKESRAFVAAAERCLQIAQKRIDKGDKTGEAHVALGTTLSLMSRWSASNRAWLPAYVRGRKSAGRLRRALAINPRATDAYMALGTFNYALKLIRKRMGTDEPDNEEFEGYEERGGGDLAQSEDGFAQLREAYQRGVYIRTGAGLLLAGILTNERPAQALPILVELREDMPENPFVHMVHLTALYNAGRIAEMERETSDYMLRLGSGTYDASFWPQAHFARGLIELRRRNWRDAVLAFEKAADGRDDRNPYVTWSMLYAGYAHDAAGQRSAARKKYQAVLKLRRRFASHEHARARLEKAFRPSDVEMRKVEL